MFKKMNEKIEKLERTYSEMIRVYLNLDRAISDNMRQESVINSQQETIKQLTDILRDKYTDGLLIAIDNKTGKPLVIRNGELIMLDKVASFQLDWDATECPNFSITFDYR